MNNGCLWLSFMQMAKFFGHFGVRALLVLYMVNSLKLSSEDTFAINACFLSLAEINGIFGGVLADRFFGLRRAVMLGGWLLFFGYICLIFPKLLYFGLFLIILGNGLFSGNISAWLGRLSLQNNSSTKKSFTYFYVMQNVGALTSTFFCSQLMLLYGFRWGFFAAAIGMLAGNLGMAFFREEKNKRPKAGWKKIIPSFIFLLVCAAGIWHVKICLWILPWTVILLFIGQGAKFLFRSKEKSGKYSKENFAAKASLFFYLGCLILFFAAQDQICSSLILLVDRAADTVIFGWKFPSSVIMSINPIVILLFGPWAARHQNGVVLPLLLLAASFGGLAWMCFMEQKVSIFGIFSAVAVLSAAELMICPLIYSYVANFGEKKHAGTIMGLVPLSFSLSYLFGNLLSRWIENDSFSLFSYGIGLGKVFLLLLSGSIFAAFMQRKIKTRVEVLSHKEFAG